MGKKPRQNRYDEHFTEDHIAQAKDWLGPARARFAPDAGRL